MSGRNKKQAIEFSKEQFLVLMKTTYLGNWVANAHRDGSPVDPNIKEYEGAQKQILAHAKNFGFAEYVDDELAKDGEFFPTRMFEETTNTHDIIDEYNESTFWDELVERLADRDFRAKYSVLEIKKMTNDERIEKLYEFIDKWAEEINQNGLDSLVKTKGRHDKS